MNKKNISEEEKLVQNYYIIIVARHLHMSLFLHNTSRIVSFQTFLLNSV